MRSHMTIRRRLSELNLDTSKQYILVNGNLVPKFDNSIGDIEEDEIKLPLKNALFSLQHVETNDAVILKEETQAPAVEVPAESANQETNYIAVDYAEVATAEVSVSDDVIVEEKLPKNNFFKKKKQ